MKQRITRRAQRFPVRLEVQALNGSPVADTYLLDLSALGARMESPTPLAPRNPLEMSFSLPGGAGDTRVLGTVVWLRPVMGAPGRYQMGVRFFNALWDIDQLGRSGKLC